MVQQRYSPVLWGYGIAQSGLVGFSHAMVQCSGEWLRDGLVGRSKVWFRSGKVMRHYV